MSPSKIGGGARREAQPTRFTDNLGELRIAEDGKVLDSLRVNFDAAPAIVSTRCSVYRHWWRSQKDGGRAGHSGTMMPSAVMEARNRTEATESP